MTISILRLAVGQTIPRPFARASSAEEAMELIGFAIAYQAGFKRPTNAQAEEFGSGVAMGYLDTETPVYRMDGVANFFAFREL